MIDWEAVPVSLWGYVAVTVFNSGFLIARASQDEHLHRKVESSRSTTSGLDEGGSSPTSRSRFSSW